MSRVRLPRRAGRRRGASAIEMALVLPLLALLVFGLLEYGWWFMIDLAATNAVREGARTATTIAGACPNGAAVAEGQLAMSDYLTRAGLASVGAASPSCTCATVATGPQFQCTLTIDFPRLVGFSLVPMPAGSVAGNTSVRAVATMRGTN